MTTPVMPPKDAINETMGVLYKQPVFLAGSVVAAEQYGIKEYGDVDLFCPTMNVLVSTVQNLLGNGYTLDDRFDRVWHRWLRYGTKQWHTNSIRLHSKSGVPVNVVFKLTDGHPTTSLSQVLESFDFGLLGMGYNLETSTYRDLRPYLFPGHNLSALPLMPNKRDAWTRGFISQYNGLREAGRYAKYWTYGYDMALVANDLVAGYEIAGSYHLGKWEDERKLIGEIYMTIAEKIRNGEVAELAESYKTLDFNDALDSILETLE